jgi:enoyl-CoA hydratase/carnithine racemase
MAYTEQDALDEAQAYWYSDADLPVDEEVAALASRLKAAYEQGLAEGTSLQAKEMYWVGLINGVIRYSWISNAIRYVGCVASPQTTLKAVLRQIGEEKEQSLNGTGSTKP